MEAMNMVDEVKKEAIVAEVLTIEQIQEKMGLATAAKDWKLVSKLAQSLVKAEADQKALELKLKQDALVAVTGSVGKLFDTLVGFLVGGNAPDATEVDSFADAILALNGTELDKADGVWYMQEFGNENGKSIRLMKGAVKEKAVKAAGDGTTKAPSASGKKFNVTTEELITEVGEASVFGDGQNGTVKAASAYTGQTIKAAYDSSTDKNWRYGIRTALLKATNRA